MQPIRPLPTTVLGVIEEVDDIKVVASVDQEIAKKLRTRLYIHVLKLIACKATDEFSRDIATEALNLEDILL